MNQPSLQSRSKVKLYSVRYGTYVEWRSDGALLILTHYHRFSVYIILADGYCSISGTANTTRYRPYICIQVFLLFSLNKIYDMKYENSKLTKQKQQEINKKKMKSKTNITPNQLILLFFTTRFTRNMFRSRLDFNLGSVLRYSEHHGFLFEILTKVPYKLLKYCLFSTQTYRRSKSKLSVSYKQTLLTGCRSSHPSLILQYSIKRLYKSLSPYSAVEKDM